MMGVTVITLGTGLQTVEEFYQTVTQLHAQTARLWKHIP